MLSQPSNPDAANVARERAYHITLTPPFPNHGNSALVGHAEQRFCIPQVVQDNGRLAPLNQCLMFFQKDKQKRMSHVHKKCDFLVSLPFSMLGQGAGGFLCSRSLLNIKIGFVSVPAE